MSRAFVPVEVTSDPHALFRGRIESTELGPLRVSEVTSDVQRVRRTPQVISSSDPQCYLITMALREDAVVLQDGPDGRTDARRHHHLRHHRALFTSSPPARRSGCW